MTVVRANRVFSKKLINMHPLCGKQWHGSKCEGSNKSFPRQNLCLMLPWYFCDFSSISLHFQFFQTSGPPVPPITEDSTISDHLHWQRQHFYIKYWSPCTSQCIPTSARLDTHHRNVSLCHCRLICLHMTWPLTQWLELTHDLKNLVSNADSH